MLLLHKVYSSPHLTTTPLKLVPTQHLGLSLTGKCGSKTLVQDIPTPVFVFLLKATNAGIGSLGAIKTGSMVARACGRPTDVSCHTQYLCVHSVCIAMCWLVLQ